MHDVYKYIMNNESGEIIKLKGWSKTVSTVTKFHFLHM